QRVPVLHYDLRDARVVELLLGIPGGQVVQVLGRLDVVAALLVARRRLVAEAAREMVEGVAPGLDADRAKVDLHVCLLRAPPAAEPVARYRKRVWVASPRRQLKSSGVPSPAFVSVAARNSTALVAQNSAKASRARISSAKISGSPMAKSN